MRSLKRETSTAFAFDRRRYSHTSMSSPTPIVQSPTRVWKPRCFGGFRSFGAANAGATSASTRTTARSRRMASGYEPGGHPSSRIRASPDRGSGAYGAADPVHANRLVTAAEPHRVDFRHGQLGAAGPRQIPRGRRDD